MVSSEKNNRNDWFRLVGKTVPIWILLAIPILAGSLAISIQEVDYILDIGHSQHLDNAQVTEDISATSIDIECPANVEVCAQSSGNSYSGNVPHVTSIDDSEASAIAAISNSVVMVDQKPVTRFELTTRLDRDDAWFGIENDSDEPQLFLIKAMVTPDVPFAIKSGTGSNIMYHQLDDDRWLVEVNPGGGTFIIEKVRGSFSDNTDILPLVIQVKVGRELALDQWNRNILSDPVMVFGPTVSTIGTASEDRVITSFKVSESGSTHLIWGIANDSQDPGVYLVRLDTTPELWINLEILERSLDRVYQRTDEGYFFVEVEPGDIGMSFSAVSGPANYSIQVEVTRVI
jgi:hypothetical protein